MPMPLSRARIPLICLMAFIMGLIQPAPSFAGWTAIPGFQPEPDHLRLPDHFTHWPNLVFDRDGYAFLSVSDTLVILSPDGGLQKKGSPRGVEYPRHLEYRRFNFQLATGDGLLYWGQQYSKDKGLTWSKEREFSNLPASMAVCGDGGLLAGYSYEHMMHSNDSAQVWNTVYRGAPFGAFPNITCNSEGWAMATATVGPLKSSVDGGLTWTNVGGPSAVKAKFLAPDPVSPDKRVWALELTPRMAPAIHEIRRNGLSIEAFPRPALTFPDSAVTAWTVSAASPAQRRFWIGTWGQGVYTSDDSGATWTQRNDGLSDLKIYVLGIRGNGDALVMTDKGLHTLGGSTVTIAGRKAGTRPAWHKAGTRSSHPPMGIFGAIGGFPFRADGRIMPERKLR